MCLAQIEDTDPHLHCPACMGHMREIMILFVFAVLESRTRHVRLPHRFNLRASAQTALLVYFPEQIIEKSSKFLWLIMLQYILEVVNVAEDYADSSLDPPLYTSLRFLLSSSQRQVVGIPTHFSSCVFLSAPSAPD